ncbi:hypothetical protein AD945_08370 [Gluconobacter albidus]|uniref:Arc-like DNA binding domain-containing protein n=1 Tax=Gluconobacter albidus TaxID=318683 RepID=A0A149TJ35_9PROT|nr:Arc family DNA-binding protein [Gluconobacter albidus]KXV48209.1 hypothetical protein AD945_08370 [Gluconobacter albidus]
MSRDHQQVRVRIPPEILLELQTSCFLNRRSLNSEIVFGLEQYIAMKAVTKKASAQPASNPDASTTTL